MKPRLRLLWRCRKSWRVLFCSFEAGLFLDVMVVIRSISAPITVAFRTGIRILPGLTLLPENVPPNKARQTKRSQKKAMTLFNDVSTSYASVADSFSPGKSAPSFLPEAPGISTNHNSKHRLDGVLNRQN